MTILISLLFLVLAVAGIAVYFVPTMIALSRNRSNKAAIIAVNVLLGWSLLGWVGALVWALADDRRAVVVQQTFYPSPDRTERAIAVNDIDTVA